MKKFLIVILGLIVVGSLFSMCDDGNEKKVSERVNQLISEGRYAEAYDTIDIASNDINVSDLNEKILNAEITSLMGDENLSAEIKATRILLAIQERIKHPYDQIDMLQKEVAVAQTSKQEEVASLLQAAIDKMNEKD